MNFNQAPKRENNQAPKAGSSYTTIDESSQHMINKELFELYNQMKKKQTSQQHNDSWNDNLG